MQQRVGKGGGRLTGMYVLLYCVCVCVCARARAHMGEGVMCIRPCTCKQCSGADGNKQVVLCVLQCVLQYV